MLQIFDPTEKIYSDLTGKFPVQSYRCNNHILVVYHYDAKRFSTPLKKITESCILTGILKIHRKPQNLGLAPKLNITEN